MSQAQPPVSPPPPADPPWFELALVLGAVALVAIVLAVSTRFDAGATTFDSTAATATTSALATTTTTTTVAETTTTTAAPVPVLIDTFEPGAGSTAVPAYGKDHLEVEFLDDGTAMITSVNPGVLPMMYPAEARDAVISFSFRPLVAPGSGVGAIVLADDPIVGDPESYVLVTVVPSSNLVAVQSFSGGSFATPTTAQIPPEAGFIEDDFNTLSISVAGGTVTVSLNGITLLSWTDPPPSLQGHYGWTLISNAAGDAMVVDDFTVMVP